jgi:hypothetical protein
VQWWKLVPDQDHQIVTAGYGTYDANNDNFYNANYATTAWNPDGTTSVTYDIAGSALTVNLAKFAGPVSAQWYDPTDGVYQNVSGSPFANTSSWVFQPPGQNQEGYNDWVLVLRANAPLTAAGVGLTGTEGSTTGTATVATFTDANPNATVSDFAATINWGDGTSTAGTVVAQNGSFAVEGAHTYAHDGQYTVGVSVNDVGGSAATTTSTATIAGTGELVANGGFETGDFSGWSESGNVAPLSYGPQTFITPNAESGQYAAGLGSVGSDGTLGQNIQTTAGQHYTLDFWLANASGGPDDFTVKWNGQTLLALNDTPAQGYTEYTFGVVGTAGTSNLEFDARQDPSHWSLDNISVTAAGSPPPASAPPPPSSPPPSGNLLINGSFETGDFTGWTLSGNVAPLSYGPQTFITPNAESGQYAAGLGSVGSDGTLGQNIQTTAGQSYTLDFWLANASGGADDFTVKWNDQTLLALNNAPQQGYTEYTYQVTGGSGSTSNLEFDARQDPSHWSLDNISVTATGSQPGNTSAQSSTPALLSQYVAASSDPGAFTSSPPVLGEPSEPQVTLVNPIHT